MDRRTQTSHHTHTHTDGETHTHTYRQTDRRLTEGQVAEGETISSRRTLDRQIHTHRQQTDTHTHTGRQTDTHTDRQSDTHSQSDRQTLTEGQVAEGEDLLETDPGQRDRHTHTQTVSQSVRQTDRHTHTQSVRQTDTH